MSTAADSDQPGASINDEEKLQQLRTDIKEIEFKLKLQENIVNQKRKQAIAQSEQEYREDLQPCTCHENPTDNTNNNQSIQCRKHLSRRFINKGCYWCSYTDCSHFGC